MYNKSRVNIFGEIELNRYLRTRSQEISTKIERESENYILNVNETGYIDHLVDVYSIKGVTVDREKLSITPSEQEFHEDDYGHSMQKKRNVIKFHLPYVGNTEVLRLSPSEGLVWSVEVSLEDNCICFELADFRNDPNSLRNDAVTIVGKIEQQLQNLQREIDSYNRSLGGVIRNMFSTRKEALLKKNDFVAALGVPIRKRDDLPETFSIPSPQNRRRLNIERPKVTEKGYKAEPTLDQSTYYEILQTIHDVGKQFERLPATYAGKGEEDLRDHFLLYLEPRFEGSATGETFNKTGKTDILIRYESSNVFIAECKFWRGEKSFLQTLSQLFDYLTWRDSKAAVIIFVPNKDLSSVIKNIEQAAPKHPNYLGYVDTSADTWINYRFHINDDRNREVKLAVLMFHIPEVN